MPHLNAAARQALLRAARRVRLEPQLRQVQRTFEPAIRRRNRRDDESLRVLMAATLGPASNCVDVGANVGDVLGEMVRLAPDGRHIAFEPLPELAEAVARRFPQVEVHHAALSDSDGEATFMRDVNSPERSSFAPRRQSAETEAFSVRVERLDSILPEDYVPHLIKLDVEGAELQVLEGGLDTLQRHKPIVAFEHGDAALEAYGTTHSDIYRLLCDRAGLSIFDMDGNGPYRLDDFERSASPPGDLFNFFARPY